MSGLEKIIARISEESARSSEEILKDARAKAHEITLDNERKIEEECGMIARKADSSARNIIDRGEASAKLRTKQILLSGRQELLSDTIAKARQHIGELSDSEYGDFILRLFKNHLPDSDCRLLLSQRSMQRLNSDVISALNAEAAQNNVKLRISMAESDIGDGFALDFGGTEENCTVDALIERNMDELTDKAKSILF